MSTVNQKKILTLNQMGAMDLLFSPLDHDFLDYAKKHTNQNFLEIGCAFGKLALKLLELDICLLACDLEQGHLEALLEKAKSKNLEQKLKIIQGDFLQVELPKNHFQGVMVAKVFHFLSPEQVQFGLKQLFDCLKPSGKLFLSTISPYVKPFKDYIPEFESKKADGEAWPGFVRDIYQYCPELKDKIPPQMHMVDDEILRRECEAVGFTVESVALDTLPDQNDEHCLDGREMVYLIAKKR